MTYQEYKTQKELLTLKTDYYTYRLNVLCVNGYASYEVKSTEEYRRCKSNFNEYFKMLQDLNKYGVKEFKKEILKERNEKRAPKTNNSTRNK